MRKQFVPSPYMIVAMLNKARKTKDWFKMSKAAHMAEQMGSNAFDYHPHDNQWIDEEEYARMHRNEGDLSDYDPDDPY